jgi:hypothetical protein
MGGQKYRRMLNFILFYLHIYRVLIGTPNLRMDDHHFVSTSQNRVEKMYPKNHYFVIRKKVGKIIFHY